MVSTVHSEFPADMMRAAHGEGGYLEATAADLLDSMKTYARDNPGSALLWALGIGFVLGWKLKPSW